MFGYKFLENVSLLLPTQAIQKILTFPHHLHLNNYCIFLTSPSSPGHVRKKFARSEVIERGGDERHSEYEAFGGDVGTDGDIFVDDDDNDSFPCGNETSESSKNALR